MAGLAVRVDIEAVKQLKARYCRTMDTKDWSGMRWVFTDDVVMDTTEAGGGVVTGADTFMEFLRGTLADRVRGEWRIKSPRLTRPRPQIDPPTARRAAQAV